MEKAMKILLVHRDIGTGSVGKIVEDLYFGIKKSGNDCKVAYAVVNKSKSIPVEDLISVCDKKTFMFHALYSRITDRCGFFGSKQTKKLINLIESFKPDIIHFHTLYGYWLNIDILFSYLRAKNIRVISTLHSCWDFTGHCCYFTKANCDKWKTQCNRCPEKKDYPSSFLMDNSVANFRDKSKLFNDCKSLEYVAPSEWMKKCVLESFLKGHAVTVIHNGIDLSSFRKNDSSLSKYGIDSEKKMILGVAACWTKRKGLEDLIELSNVLPPNFQVVVVGVNGKQLKRLPKNIIGIKRTENKEDLAALYSSATVFFNPTYEDNYPTVNIEAFACGTPIVTYQTGGSPEIINETGFGKVIKHKDYQTLIDYAASIDKNDFEPSLELLSSFSREKMVENYLLLYSKEND